MAMFNFLFNIITRSVVVLLVAMLSINYLPNQLLSDFQIEPKYKEALEYDTVVPEWNNKLSAGAEYIQLNNILGPESIAIHPTTGLWYTGLADGRLVELDPAQKYKVRLVMRFKESDRCRDNVATLNHECGRFLQARFQNQTLYIVEASTGLWKIDIKGRSKTLVGPKRPLHKVTLYNSFTIDPVNPNLAYLTISSTKWGVQRILWSMVEYDVSGEVVAVDMSSGKSTIVMDGLVMVNGIDVDPKRDQLVFTETPTSKVSSVSLKELRAAFKEAKDGAKLELNRRTLIPLLPGHPDNIVIEGDIAYIALPMVKASGKDIVDYLGTMPNVRKTVARAIFGIGQLMEHVCKNIYHHPLLDAYSREFKSGHILYELFNKHQSGVFEYNLDSGSSRFLGSDAFSFVSEAIPDPKNKGTLLLGSFRSPFIVKVKV